MEPTDGRALTSIMACDVKCKEHDRPGFTYSIIIFLIFIFMHCLNVSYLYYKG